MEMNSHLRLQIAGVKVKLGYETSKVNLLSCPVAPADHGREALSPRLRQTNAALPTWKNGATIYP
jgi:hypothetical protein